MTAALPPRYVEWLDFFFGRVARDASDVWQMDWDFKATPMEAVDLFTHTMENCGRDFKPFSDVQVAAGLKALLFDTHTTIAREISDASVPEVKRLSAIRSLKSLYANCLARRSPPVLGHLNETAGNPLEYVTYMLWDVSPLARLISVASPSSNKSALIESLGHVLNLPQANPACTESVLHGLGHLAGSHPKVREQITASIDYFLSHRPIVRPELKTYAEAARTGMIL